MDVLGGTVRLDNKVGGIISMRFWVQNLPLTKKKKKTKMVVLFLWDIYFCKIRRVFNIKKKKKNAKITSSRWLLEIDNFKELSQVTIKDNFAAW